MNQPLPRLVVDTNLLVSALFVGSATARQILDRMLHGTLLCFLSGNLRRVGNQKQVE